MAGFLGSGCLLIGYRSFGSTTAAFIIPACEQKFGGECLVRNNLIHLSAEATRVELPSQLALANAVL